MFKKIELIDLEGISSSHWKGAFELTKEIDEFDIALRLELKAPLWTGDKKL